MKKLLGFVVMLGLLTITAYATDNNTLQTFSSGDTGVWDQSTWDNAVFGD